MELSSPAHYVRPFHNMNVYGGDDTKQGLVHKRFLRPFHDMNVYGGDDTKQGLVHERFWSL